MASRVEWHLHTELREDQSIAMAIYFRAKTALASLLLLALAVFPGCVYKQQFGLLI